MEEGENQKRKNALSDHGSQQELLLKKVEDILHRTDVDSWKKGGEPLKHNQLFEKPRKTWEEVYTLNIPAGVLVMRASTPLRSEFVGRGFSHYPAANTNFTVELRAEGWKHTELTDPYARSRSADRSCTLLADGGIARKLYVSLEGIYKNFFSTKVSSFKKEAYLFIQKLINRLRDETIDNWERTEDTPGCVDLSCVVDGYQVTVSKGYYGGREEYALLVKKGSLSTKILDRALTVALYDAVNDLGQTSRLMTLTKALEEL